MWWSARNTTRIPDPNSMERWAFAWDIMIRFILVCWSSPGVAAITSSIAVAPATVLFPSQSLLDKYTFISMRSINISVFFRWVAAATRYSIKGPSTSFANENKWRVWESPCSANTPIWIGFSLNISATSNATLCDGRHCDSRSPILKKRDSRERRVRSGRNPNTWRSARSLKSLLWTQSR